MSEFLRKIYFFFRRGRFENDLEQELRFHLEMAAAEQGSSTSFGNVLQVKEGSRDVDIRVVGKLGA